MQRRVTTPSYLYLGSGLAWGSCESRRRALIRLGRDVISLAYEQYQTRPKLLARFEVRTAIGPWPTRLNAAVLAIAHKERPGIVWVDRGTLIWPDTVSRLRAMGCLTVHYNADDVLNRRNLWGSFLRSIPSYDVHVTTNIPNIVDLRRMGARLVIPIKFGFDDEVFYPRDLSMEDSRLLGADVSFVGHWEPATEALLERLALECEVVLRVRGHNWHRARSSRLKAITGEPLYLDEYARAICASKVNLGIVSALNRNQTTHRTFEIPACGGFLLAPRTKEAIELYHEDREAVFFCGPDELADKVRFYLERETDRHLIAEAGHQRCVTSGYSWVDRMRELIPQIEQRLAP